MKQILNETQQTHYVDSSDMIKFIDINSEMKWNDICDFVINKNICDGEYGSSLWVKKDLIKNKEEYNEEQFYWISEFFNAHPWIERMMIVFDS